MKRTELVINLGTIRVDIEVEDEFDPEKVAESRFQALVEYVEKEIGGTMEQGAYFMTLPPLSEVKAKIIEVK